MRNFRKLAAATFAGAGISVMGAVSLHAQDQSNFDYTDVFNLEYATGMQEMPDGKALVYERRSIDVMTDRLRTNIWRVNLDGTGHRPVLSGKAQYRMPRFSPDGTRMAYVSSHEGKNQIYVRWLDSGETARVTDVPRSPGSISWSPDSSSIAFTMFMPSHQKPFFKMPAKPKGAKWAGNAKVITNTTYKRDGAGFRPNGFMHAFVVPADGGTPRQITEGNFNHGSNIEWLKDGNTVVISANRTDDPDNNPRESDLFAVDVASGAMTALTDRRGPDSNARVSPDGTKIAFTGFDDEGISSPNTNLYVMNIDGTDKQQLLTTLDRSVRNIQWSGDSQGLYYRYNDLGKGLVAYVSLSGAGRVLTDQLGGTSLGRPYASGTYKALSNGQIAYTINRHDRPADIAVQNRIGQVTQLTDLNSDALGHKTMGNLQELNFKSSFDGRDLQAWVVTPPNFDSSKKYPLILEIHGGPHTAYGPVYSTEVQLMAAKGYVVVYGNPRGSTSYGAEFANTIHHNYPSNDYDDLIDTVDAAIELGFVDEDNLFVTGGSGGGVLTAWIIGKTDRFKAAVVAKPVINWISFVLTADMYVMGSQYWFPDKPWNAIDHYWQRSPLSLVGNVTTPTMLLTGENDVRTPMSETEQYYGALRLQGVESAMVRIPGASHGIAAKPSNLIQKVGNIVAWFDKYKQ